MRPEPIEPGVARFPVRTPTLPPATHTNSYALGTREVLWVEPASPYEDEQAASADFLKQLAGEGRRLMGVFITHHHADHVGGLAYAAAMNVPLYMHEATRDLIASRLGTSAAQVQILRDGDTLHLDGPTPQAWRVLHTPGHAAGHLCLYEEERGMLIAGDMVASEGSILIAPDEGDMREYCTQLARLDAFGARLVLPAHGAPIREAVFARTLAHRLMREAKVKDALALTREGTLDDLLPHAYADTPQTLWPLARLSLEAHLGKLVAEGWATQHPLGTWHTNA